MCNRKDKFNHRLNDTICDITCKGLSIAAGVAAVSVMISILNNWEAISFIFGG